MTTAPADHSLASADVERCLALTRGDVDLLKTLLHADLWYVHSSGRRESGDALLQAIASRALVYGPIDCMSRRTTVIVDVGFVEAELSFSVCLDGASSGRRVRASSAWLREDGKWRMTACINVPISGSLSDGTALTAKSDATDA